MSQHTQLDKVYRAFQLWRNNKPNTRIATPETLRQQAISLLSDYPAARICKTLSISGSQSAKWRQADNSQMSRLAFVRASTA